MSFLIRVSGQDSGFFGRIARLGSDDDESVFRRGGIEADADAVDAVLFGQVPERRGQDGELDCLLAAAQRQRNRFPLAAGDVDFRLISGEIRHRFAVDGDQHVAFLHAGFLGRRTGRRMHVDRNQHGKERPGDFFRLELTGRVRVFSRDVRDLHRLAVPDHIQFDRADREQDLVEDDFPPGREERFSVDLDDPVAGAQPRLPLRPRLIDGQDGELAHFRRVLRQPDPPDETGDQQPGENVEERPGHSRDDPVERFGARQLRAVRRFRDRVGRVDLRQLDVAAERKPAEPVLHTVDFLPPERFETERKRIDVQPAPFGGEEVPELVRKDAESDGHKDEDHGKYVKNPIHIDAVPLWL